MRKIYKIVCNTCEDQVKQTSVDTCFLTCEFCGEKPVRIIELVEKQDWIPTTQKVEELEEDWYKLTVKKEGEEPFVTFGELLNGHWRFFDYEWNDFSEEIPWSGIVTHYRPLPEPPKGEKVDS